MKIIALIPARGGSKRVKNKNMRDLAGHPLLYWTLKAARDSGIFHEIIVSSDDSFILTYTPFTMNSWMDPDGHIKNVRAFKRPDEYATDLSPDIEWVKHALDQLAPEGVDAFAILRPTSPFRTSATIERALQTFLKCQPCDSIRAVEACKQHPFKMWELDSSWRMIPFCWEMDEFHRSRREDMACSLPYQKLPPVLIQNASLEMAWVKTVTQWNSISGTMVAPFFTEGSEGFDINTQHDFFMAETMIEKGMVRLG